MEENKGFTRRRYKRLTTVGQALEGTLKAIGKTGVLLFAKIVDNWEEVVGEALSRVSAPQSLSKRTLKIGVSQPVWADSMLYLKGDIINKVNGLFKTKVIDDVKIVFQLDFLPLNNDKMIKAGDLGKDDEPLELTKTETKELEDMMSQVTDSQLRATLKRVILKDYRAKKSRKIDL